MSYLDDLLNRILCYDIVVECLADAMASSEQGEEEEETVTKKQGSPAKKEKTLASLEESVAKTEVVVKKALVMKESVVKTVEEGNVEEVTVEKVKRGEEKVTAEKVTTEKVTAEEETAKEETSEEISEEEEEQSPPPKKVKTLATLLQQHRFQLLHNSKLRGSRPVPPPKLDHQRKRNPPSLGDGPQITKFQREDRASFKVFLPKVPNNLEEKDLDDLFTEKFGPVHRAKRDSGRAYAFVEFQNEDDAAKAIVAGKVTVEDQDIQVEKALNREEREAKKLKAKESNVYLGCLPVAHIVQEELFQHLAAFEPDLVQLAESDRDGLLHVVIRLKNFSSEVYRAKFFVAKKTVIPARVPAHLRASM